MKYREVFKNAKTLVFDEGLDSVDCEKRFTVPFAPEKAEIVLLGLGFFELYVNGKRVSDDLFLHLSTDYAERPSMKWSKGRPFDEKLGHRVYVKRYEIGLEKGENTLSVSLGRGWYGNAGNEKYGDLTLAYALTAVCGGEKFELYSDGDIECREGSVREYSLTKGETQDLSAGKSVRPRVSEPIDTEYLFSDCPADRVIERITPKKVSEGLYDVGRNITGYPVFRAEKRDNDRTVTVTYGETLKDGDIDPEHSYGQKDEFMIPAGEERVFHTRYTWHGFRFFRVEGDCALLEVDFIHSDVAVSASFRCSDRTVNEYNDVFIHTQLCNMHCGIPSDCPQIERRGYTGDGQLACGAVMTTLDAERFYRKWIDDISDCQDRVGGHVQYTAPFILSGGGPGGWGSAIVEVPWEFYRFYGDIDPMRRLLPQMMKYFDYLEAHSEEGIVSSDNPNEWCLGDWCTPGERNNIPPRGLVNNYFYLKSLETVKKICRITGDDRYLSEVERRIKERRIATEEKYYDGVTGNFALTEDPDSIQANLFAADLHLGDSRTWDNAVKYYESTGKFNTGIFGTDILIRLMFERRRPDIAVKLLSDREFPSFGYMFENGATTLWEHWEGRRSHSHPMFGAAVRWIYEYILGIRQTEGSAGYSDYVIDPVATEYIPSAEGYVTTVRGRIYVKYDTVDGKVKIESGIEK
ncbi:MAG: family 78 glycoside hydrolase catalytic domain [Clostridia bacterium]|nr:family 78 glycoside hydrolase catalytic domain [Clostridia bacterium]